MNEQISNRLGVAHVRDTMMQVGCGLYRREPVASYLVFYRSFSRYGLPLEIYVDKAGFFRNDDGSLT